MAARWQDAAAQQAEVVSARLRELMSSGLGLLRTELGLDLGLDPERYPSWAILLVAVLGLLVVGLVWAATCAGRKGAGREKEPLSSSVAAVSSSRAPAGKNQKIDDQKKKAKKKSAEKGKPNGRTAVELPEEEAVPVLLKETLKQPLETEKKTEKSKGKKKKPKAEAKQVHDVSALEGKEFEEGAWETKVSNREKRQRKRDKVLNDVGSGDANLHGTDATTVASAEQPTAMATVSIVPRKTKGEPVHTNQLTGVKSGTGDSVSQDSLGWIEAPDVNGGAWTDVPMKIPSQISGGEEKKWTPMQATSAANRNQETTTWRPDTGDTNGPAKDWSAPLVRKTWGEHTLFPSIGSSSEPVPQSSTTDLQWDSVLTPIDDEWSGANGLPPADPSSDWNAPAEEWGNWVEEEAAQPPQPEEPVSEVQKLSEDEREKEESIAQGSGGGKSKKKKKKKKKQGEDASSPVQDTEEPEKEPTVEVQVQEDVLKVQVQQEKVIPVKTTSTSESVELFIKSDQPCRSLLEEEKPPGPVLIEPSVTVSDSTSQNPSQVPEGLPEPEPSVSTMKQNSVPPPSQTKSEESWESPKQVKKKKKARRET
uniref:Metadherin n=1 Tax=Latimeria chalumnae TaxID=7897 RepID=H3A138_LATCH